MIPYKYLYPFGEESVRKIAYYFDYDLPPGTTSSDCSDKLLRWVEDWQKNPETGSLRAFERPDGTLALLDTRSYALRSSVVLQGIDKAVYDYCDCVRSLASICDHLARSFPQIKLSKNAVRSFLDALVANGYMLCDSSSYLSLALRSEFIDSAPDKAPQEQMLAQVSRT